MSNDHHWHARIDDGNPEPRSRNLGHVVKSAEGLALLEVISQLEARIDVQVEELPEQIASSVSKLLEEKILDPEQVRWVKLAIQNEAQSIAFRKAMIEKTITALVWLTIVTIGTASWSLIKEFLSNRGFKI